MTHSLKKKNLTWLRFVIENPLMLRKIAETIVPSQTSLEYTGILNLVLPGTFNWQISLFICKQVQFFRKCREITPSESQSKSINTFRNICYTFLLTMSSITYYLEGGVFPVSNREFEIVKIWRIIWNDKLTAAAAKPDQITITSRYLRFVLTNSPSDFILISISMIFYEESLQKTQ